MDNYKYKKYEYNKFINKQKQNDDVYNVFFDNYIKKYINELYKHSSNIQTMEQYIIKYNDIYNSFKLLDENCVLYYHVLIDIKLNKCIGIALTVTINDSLIKNDYRNFKHLKKYIKLNSKIIYLKNLYIDPLYRGKKLCNYLISRIKKNAQKHLINYMLCEINVNNTPSIKCFKTNDFIKTNINSYMNAPFYYIKLI